MVEDDQATVVAFTSHRSREGVTTVVAGLARSFGTADPSTVLVLDVAPSRRRIADLLGAKNHQVDFRGAEIDSLNLEDIIVHDDKTGVDILTLSDAGPSSPRSVSKARLFLKQILRSYRVILVDAGALSKGSASHWLTLSNYRVLVIDASVATREVLEYRRKQFGHNGISLSGSILNKRSYPIPKALYWLVR